MRQRCEDPNATSYKYYGAKGIRVLWKSFEEFQRDMQEGYADNLTLGRKKNDQHYCKRNCRWETPAQQNRNYSRNVWITARGRSQLITDWAKELGIRYQTISKRLKLGWPVERAVFTDTKETKLYKIGDRKMTLIEWCDYYNIKIKTVYRRIGLGWKLRDALTIVPQSRTQ